MRKHSRYAWAAGAVLLYGLLGFLLAPYLLERTLVNTLREDFGASLRVENIDINPFALSLRVGGLELDNPAGEPTARIGEIFANFQLGSVFTRALTFAEIRITSPRLFVTRDESGSLDFAYLLKSAEAEPDAVEAADEQAESLPALLVFNFAIEDLSVAWNDRFPLDPVRTRVGPISIAITELNTLPDRSGRQTVVIETEESGTLSWSGDLQLNPLRSSGRASVKDTRFPLITSYIRRQSGIEIVDGRGNIEMDYAVSASASGDIEAAVSNFNLALDDIVLRTFADDSGLDFAGADRQFLTLPKFRLRDGQLRWPQQTVTLGSVSIENPQVDISRDKNGVFSLEPRPQRVAQQAPAGGEPEAAAGTGSEPKAAANAGIEAAPGGGPTDDAENPWQVSIDRLAVSGLVFNLLDQTVEPAAALGITDFNLEIKDLSNEPGKRFPTRLGLQAKSGGQVSLDGEFSLLPRPAFDFDLKLDAVQLAGAQPYISQQANLSLNSGAANLRGRISGAAEDPLAFAGDLQIVDLAIAESINEKRLASWKKFSADKIAFSIAKRQLDISTLRFDQPYGDILIDEDGSINIGQVRKTGSAEAGAEPTQAETGPMQAEAEPMRAEAEDAADADETAFNIRIGDIAVADGSADFADLSLPLPFSTKIQSLNGRVSTVSSRSSEASRVSLEGNIDDYGFVRIGGTVTPLDPSRNTDLLLSFENIEVRRFTPYSIPIAGRKVRSGTLDLELGYRIEGGALVGENSILLRDFELGEKVPYPGALDLPLGLAVALLKDASGKIAIDLPVRGRVDDPEFSYGGVILDSLGNLLTRIVASPFAALGRMLGMEASELEYVRFIEGRSDLTPPGREKAVTLAQALSQRPELGLQIAGVFDPVADALALRSARLDDLLDRKISELASGSDPETQYSDLRRQALEQLFREQLIAQYPQDEMAALRRQFTTSTTVEGQTGDTTTLDNLAYANALRDRLIALQAIGENDLAELANVRAEALRAALLAADASLGNRIRLTDSVAVEPGQGEPIRMKVSLTSLSG